MFLTGQVLWILYNRRFDVLFDVAELNGHCLGGGLQYLCPTVIVLALYLQRGPRCCVVVLANRIHQAKGGRAAPLGPRTPPPLFFQPSWHTAPPGSTRSDLEKENAPLSDCGAHCLNIHVFLAIAFFYLPLMHPLNLISPPQGSSTLGWNSPRLLEEGL